MTVDVSLYDDVVDITIDYLGPAAERFVERQIMTHLHKPPEKLTQRDLSKLIDWIKLAISLLTDDTNTVEDYIESLQELADGKIRPRRSR